MAYAFTASAPVNITLTTYADVVVAALAVEHAIWLRVYNRGADNNIIVGKSASGGSVLDEGSYPYAAGETRVIGPFTITTGGKVQAKLGAVGDFMVTPEGWTGP